MKEVIKQGMRSLINGAVNLWGTFFRPPTVTFL